VLASMVFSALQPAYVEDPEDMEPSESGELE